jgi:hypothetical protein
LAAVEFCSIVKGRLTDKVRESWAALNDVEPLSICLENA